MATQVKQYDIQTTTYKTAGTASAYELTIPKLTSLVDELTFVVEFHVENDASATLNINSLGAHVITTSEWNAIWAWDLKVEGRYMLTYDAWMACFIVSGMVDSEVESMISWGGLNIWDMFYVNHNTYRWYSELKNYYCSHYTEAVSATHNIVHYYLLNGKGAPIMKNGTIATRTNDHHFSINSSTRYSNICLFTIIWDDLYTIVKKYEDYNTWSVYFAMYKVTWIGTANPQQTQLTITLNTPWTRNFPWNTFVWYDGTYYYYMLTDLQDPSTYERYQLIWNTLTYVDTWIPPVWIPTIIYGNVPEFNYPLFFISWDGYYIWNNNMLTKYDLITWVVIDIQFYWTRYWAYPDEVRTNINTTGDMHAIFKAFSN